LVGVIPEVSVVAPTYGRRDQLPAFVEPLLADPQLHELVIAVDGSNDGSVEWLTDRARTDDRLIVLDLPNRGAGATRQAGIEAASGDVVLLLDDDVIAAPGLVQGHLHHHRELSSKLVLGYMPNDWTRLPPGRRGIAFVYRRAYEHHCSEFARDPEFILHGFWGGNFSMPRADFLRVGVVGLDVKRGQDDREFGIRCGKAGVRAVFDPFLVGEHLYDRSIEQFRRDCRIQGESRVLLHDAHADVLGSELNEAPGGPHVADAVGMGLPAPLRPVWRAFGRNPLFPLVSWLLAAAFAAAVRLEHLGFEVALARGIGSIETMRGVLDRS
jgi:glycosyltransferase involved in cell wall biosynthesis